jgi:ERCC4-type nuclease
MVYDSDPSSPDLNEIAEVTDYVVSCACKGNAAYTIEKKQIQDFTTS